jgi:hypothetical protein
MAGFEHRFHPEEVISAPDGSWYRSMSASLAFRGSDGATSVRKGLLLPASASSGAREGLGPSRSPPVGGAGSQASCGPRSFRTDRRRLQKPTGWRRL